MDSKEIRRLFLEFFREKGHEVLPSSSLIPADDPSLLFTNAGMVQFKGVFLGAETIPYKRAVTVQKCLRAGGKHNDLENVGRTARHHTFFEMLGNFSFGDYFKKDAIAWAWEFLTSTLGLSKDRLWVSVYKKDDEAERLWKEFTDVSHERIVRLGEKDNFWQMGDIGPCGPCSEIIIDQGPHVGCGRSTCAVGCDCDRFLELWNLVFMQYNRDPSMNLTALPRPSIDTGMGIERLSAVLQLRPTNFDTDLFSNIISLIESISGRRYGKDSNTDVSIRVIADHIRAVAFLLAEGIMPSNEGRGYVLRRIIRRAARHGRLLGLDEPFLYRVLDAVDETMGDIYPELLEEPERARKVLRFEEERFVHTLTQGMRLLDELIDNVVASDSKLLPGAELFRLYDTFGFPLDLAQDIATDKGLHIDIQGFEKEMELQRHRARASWVGAEEGVAPLYKEILKEIGHTDFLGYVSLEADAKLLRIIKDGRIVRDAKEGDEVELFFDMTPFYGESGGQVGDTGAIKTKAAKIMVKDTKRPVSELISHMATIKTGRVSQGDILHLHVDEDRRRAIMRNHTATHLLQAALMVVLGDHVKQAGSLVAPERLRFDFTHFYPMEGHEIEEVGEIVNNKVIENIPLDIKDMAIEDAIASGATALFGERYGDRVRVIRIGDFSAELCGGTHCRATGDIGLFKIISEGSVAAGIRRIEAVTGRYAINYFKEQEDEMLKIASLFKSRDIKVSSRVERLLKDSRELEKEVESLRTKAALGKSMSYEDDVRVIKGIKVIAKRFDGMELKDLRNLADRLRDKMGSGVIVLGSARDSQASVIAVVSKDLTQRFHAGEILKDVIAVAGGKGGGRADMAQGGVKDIERLDDVLKAVYEIIGRM